MDDTVTLSMVEAKEAQNAARRSELRKRQGEVLSIAEPDPNFPPECCCIKPVIYHNIRVQIPVNQQRFMYILCGLYLSLIVLIIYNIVAAFVNFIFGGSALHFGLSFLYLIGLPGAWVLWYYNIYCATTESNKPRQLLGILGLFLGVAFDVWMAVGVSGFGGCGWLITLGSTGSLPRFIVLLIAAILWTLHALLLCFMMLRYWRVSSSLIKGGARIYRETVV